jgi:uncharacterized protein YciI
MKFTLLILALFIFHNVIAQLNFPDFLQGTWKMENKNNYEHWDKINDNTMKGFSFTSNSGEILVYEYLEIFKSKKGIVYTATVLNQNQGRGISFKLNKVGDTYSFENPNHDFPQRISYKKISETEVFVEVSDGKQNGFSFKMTKQITKAFDKDTTILNPNFDPELAQKLGADDFGMKRYILVILKTGSNQTTDKDFISECFRGHLDNINRLVEDDKLVVAGPLGKNDNSYRGIFILNVATIEEAQSLLQTDPAIKEGLLDAELYSWYGSAALPEYLPASDKIWKSNP